eukprot:scaffold73360_cov66-Phaeocystis_antarctica.AAC.1
MRIQKGRACFLSGFGFLSSRITPCRKPSCSPSKKHEFACSHRLQLKVAKRMAAATEACARRSKGCL